MHRKPIVLQCDTNQVSPSLHYASEALIYFSWSLGGNSFRAEFLTELSDVMMSFEEEMILS